MLVQVYKQRVREQQRLIAKAATAMENLRTAGRLFA